MTVEPSIIFEVFGILGSCATVYAAIRADLARAIAKAEEAATSANKAHDRIDRMQEAKR